jgi:hypothetical protein
VTGSGGILPFARVLLPTALIEVYAYEQLRAYQNAVTAGVARDSSFTEKCGNWVTALYNGLRRK